MLTGVLKSWPYKAEVEKKKIQCDSYSNTQLKSNSLNFSMHQD